MITDIVFEQNYAKKVESHIKNVAEKAYLEGRQQGWNELILVLNRLQNDNMEISQENIINYLKELIN